MSPQGFLPSQRDASVLRQLFVNILPYFSPLPRRLLSSDVVVGVGRPASSCLPHVCRPLLFPSPFSESVLAFSFQNPGTGARHICVIRSKGDPKEHTATPPGAWWTVWTGGCPCSGELLSVCQDIAKFLSQVPGKKILRGL